MVPRNSRESLLSVEESPLPSVMDVSVQKALCTSTPIEATRGRGYNGVRVSSVLSAWLYGGYDKARRA